MMKKLCAVLFALLLSSQFIVPAQADESENPYDHTFIYCTADEVNGRLEPNIHSQIVAYAMKGWQLETSGLIINHYVQIYGSENGTCWIHIDYLSETQDCISAQNISGGRVKVRALPDSRSGVKAYVKSNQYVEFSRTLFGWGYIENKGWVSLEFFETIIP